MGEKQINEFRITAKENNKQTLRESQKRVFTKPPQRRREQSLLKNEFIFYQSRDSLKSFTCTLFIAVITIAKLNTEHSDKFEKKNVRKLSRRGSRSPDNAKFSHYTLFGRQRNAPRIITHVHSHCTAH